MKLILIYSDIFMERERLIIEALPGLTYKKPSFEPSSCQQDYGVPIPKQLFLVIMETAIVIIITIRFVYSRILNCRVLLSVRSRLGRH